LHNISQPYLEAILHNKATKPSLPDLEVKAIRFTMAKLCPLCASSKKKLIARRSEIQRIIEALEPVDRQHIAHLHESRRIHEELQKLSLEEQAIMIADNTYPVELFYFYGVPAGIDAFHSLQWVLSNVNFERWNKDFEERQRFLKELEEELERVVGALEVIDKTVEKSVGGWKRLWKNWPCND
jgi:hypothetical protein